MTSRATVPSRHHLFLLSLLLAPLTGLAQEEGSTPARPAEDAPRVPDAEKPKQDEGPKLDLEGLEDPAGTGTAVPVPNAETPGQAGQETFTERLQPTTTLAQRAAAILDRTTLGGYAEHDFILPQQGVSTFRNHRYVLFVYSHISERVSTATEIEFEFAGSPLKRDGILGAGEVLLEFSVVDLMLTDWATFRAGVILVPVGAYNLRHDAPAQELPERPIAYTTVVPTTWFESGAGFLGGFDLGRDWRLSYEVYAVNGLDAKILDGQGFRAARGSHLEDNNDDKALTGRVSVSPFLGLEAGLSGYTGAYDLEGRRVNMVNADVFWRLGALDLTGEVVRAFIDPGYVQGFPNNSTANTRDRVPTGMFGFYGQANYRFRIEPFFRLLPDEWKEGHFTASLRYEEKDTDTEFITAGDVARLTLGLNFRPLPPYVLKTSYFWEKSGGDGVQPHAWSGDFWKDGHWTFLASVAYLF
ncbi:hypothetical protein NR798_26150 [Archangium gephyra]|uniref:hypothetical protein n=1 Tax=Archangium gephyra TaxID=48 RepID=UPI0035D46509